MINLQNTENRVTSQQGEDGVIQAILSEIGWTNQIAVEFGALDGETDNTLLLKAMRWQVFQINGEKLTENIHQAYMTPENCNQVFAELGVPKEFDVLSIDVDFNDYYIWEALEYRPRLLVIEHNASIPPDESRVVKYEKDRVWDGTNYFGASLLALEKLSKKKGYSLVYVESTGTNAFFVRDDCLKNLQVLTAKQAYQTPKYGGNNGGHAQSQETMIEV
jgi:hypothetical protein